MHQTTELLVQTIWRKWISSVISRIRNILFKISSRSFRNYAHILTFQFNNIWSSYPYQKQAQMF